MQLLGFGQLATWAGLLLTLGVREGPCHLRQRGEQGLELIPQVPASCVSLRAGGYPRQPAPPAHQEQRRGSAQLTSGAAWLRVRCVGVLRGLPPSEEVRRRKSKVWPPCLSDQSLCTNRWKTHNWAGPQLCPPLHLQAACRWHMALVLSASPCRLVSDSSLHPPGVGNHTVT